MKQTLLIAIIIGAALLSGFRTTPNKGLALEIQQLGGQLGTLNQQALTAVRATGKESAALPYLYQGRPLLDRVIDLSKQTGNAKLMADSQKAVDAWKQAIIEYGGRL